MVQSTIYACSPSTFPPKHSRRVLHRPAWGVPTRAPPGRQGRWSRRAAPGRRGKPQPPHLRATAARRACEAEAQPWYALLQWLTDRCGVGSGGPAGVLDATSVPRWLHLGTGRATCRPPAVATWSCSGAALLRRRPKGLLPAARQELLDPSKAWWGGRRGRLADWPPYSISVSLGVVPRWYSRVVEVPVRIEVAAGFVAPGASEPPRLQPSWPPGGSRPAHG